MPGQLTTHVLDTMHGRPAAGMTLQLWWLSLTETGADTRRLLKTVQTGPDGRTHAPLLKDSKLLVGTYELIFEVGTYFKALGLESTHPPFLDRVPVRFGISDPESHYHVPLLVTPWAYSTYRGS